MRLVVLLGPQRFQPTLREVVDSLGVEGRIAAVTAGWQEREAEDAELSNHLGGRVVNLRLHARGEELLGAEPELFARLRRRQDRLKRLQMLYRLRLDPQLGALRKLHERHGDAELETEREHALELVRALDEHHLERVRAVHREAEMPRPAPETGPETGPEPGDGRHPELERHREEVAETLTDCSALAIAGGHVAVLLNRLRLFRVLERTPEGMPVFAWSAGAMAIAERIVLFHDNPPQGAGNAELLDAGLGLVGAGLAGRALLPLPHASRRLRLGDRRRVSTFARRFAPRVPVTLDSGARLVLGGGRLIEAEGSERLLPNGRRELLAAEGAA